MATENNAKSTCCGCLQLQKVCVLIGVLDVISCIIFGVAILPVLLIGIIPSMLLIIGASRSDRHSMWPWIIINAVLTILCGSALIICIGFSSDVINAIEKRQILSDLDEDEMLAAEMILAISIIFLILSFISNGIRLHAVCKYMVFLRQKHQQRKSQNQGPIVQDNKLQAV